jgi:hypothetical protein
MGALEFVYGAVVGGLISSFIAITVFTLLVESSSSNSSGIPPLISAAVGLVCAALLMAGGLVASERAPWFGTALLFASGFTALWSVILSFAQQERWVPLIILGVVIIAGVLHGKWRFERAEAAEFEATTEPEANTAEGDLDA